MSLVKGVIRSFVKMKPNTDSVFDLQLNGFYEFSYKLSQIIYLVSWVFKELNLGKKMTCQGARQKLELTEVTTDHF